MNDTYSSIEVCEEFRKLHERIKSLENENAILRAALAEADQCIEDVCTGGRLECTVCGKIRPCLCQDT